MARIVVDPVTRIEGHLRIEVNVDKDNVIRNAVSTGTMWRGLEVILKGVLVVELELEAAVVNQLGRVVEILGELR